VPPPPAARTGGGSRLSPEHRAVSPYGRLRRNRSFLLLWSGRAISNLGNHFFELAVMWYVFVASGSSLGVAGMGVAFQLAPVLAGPVAGVLVDRWDQRRTMIVSDCIRAAIVGGMVLLAWRGILGVWTAMVAVFLLQVVGVFFGPARQAFVPQILGREDLLAATGIMSGTNNAIGVAGKALAGFWVAAAGAAWAFAVDAASFVVSAASIFAIGAVAAAPTRASDAPQRRRFVSEIRAGWAVVAERPVILHLILFGTAANAVFAMTAPVLPAYVHDQLRAGAWALGLVESAAFVGGMLGGFLVGLAARRIPAGRMFAAATAVYGLATAAVGLTRSAPPAFALFAAGGFALAFNGAPMESLFQALIPQEFMGRAFGLMQAAAVALMPVGTLVGGYLGDARGPATVLIVTGGLMAVLASVMLSDRRIRTAQVTSPG
jgi:DHA3 family macrolide efflux protein-like MFS transporter